MLPISTHLWECKVNGETWLYELSNESIDINIPLILMMRWEITYWAMMSYYSNKASMMYELNLMELYTEHR